MRHWTSEERKRQSEMIKSWRPWEKAAGPQTDGGKKVSKMNAYKHGLRSAEIKAIRKFLRDQVDSILML